jgi:3-deoxy-D-manno-octulosonate 8-phosphate phosphatase (KDO 8-P phosphatase)
MKPGTDELTAKAAAVKLLVFDVDGVLTDGGLYYGPGGEMMKRFDVRDGHGIVLARLTGMPSAILTARTSEIVAVRGKELQMAAVFQGYKDKAEGLRALCEQLQLAPEACAYMGDDVNDLAPMARVVLPACPADAAPEVRQACLFVSRQSGGRGAARELIELVLRATGRWDQALKIMKDGHLTV